MKTGDSLNSMSDAYTLPGMLSSGNSDTGRTKDDRVNPPAKPPRLELSTFYSVAISKTDQVLEGGYGRYIHLRRR